MMRPQRGLTMVEVLAAMVIFSMGAVVLFGWIGQTADRLGRINKEQALLFGELTAIEFARTLNPMHRPDGEESIGDASIRWQATPVGSEQASRTPTGVEGIYVVQLFKVQLQVAVDRAGKSERTLWLAGWRQVRSGKSVNPFLSIGASPAGAAPAITAPR